ncbi:MAG: (2Fe-2S)-binding protein [Pseudomonadota bacterium]
MKQTMNFKVNGEHYELLVDTRSTLLEVLREEIGLTGTKEGCSLGACGTCTVILDGKPVLSCLVLAVDAEGKEVLTIEGLAQGDTLHPIQKAFVEHGAIQCGYCTPGMVMSAKALLDQNPKPGYEEIKKAISGNICRCTGYTKIIEAIQSVK